MNGHCDSVRVESDSVVRELEVQRLRTGVAVEVAPRLWAYLGDEGLIGPVLVDIVDRWATRPGGLPLLGRGGFVAAYLDATERDAAGRPWWQLCRERDGDGRPVADELYPRRVWTYHARRLSRLHPADAATVDVPDPLPAGLVGELVVERLRTVVAVEVAAGVPDWLGKNSGAVGAIVRDVVARWLALPADRRPVLTGHGQFVEDYVAQVLYADPTDDEYRAEFCPPGQQPLDWDTYARAVWIHHIDQLAGAR